MEDLGRMVYKHRKMRGKILVGVSRNMLWLLTAKNEAANSLWFQMAAQPIVCVSRFFDYPQAKASLLSSVPEGSDVLSIQFFSTEWRFPGDNNFSTRLLTRLVAIMVNKPRWIRVGASPQPQILEWGIAKNLSMAFSKKFAI